MITTLKSSSCNKIRREFAPEGLFKLSVGVSCELGTANRHRSRLWEPSVVQNLRISVNYGYQQLLDSQEMPEVFVESMDLPYGKAWYHSAVMNYLCSRGRRVDIFVCRPVFRVVVFLYTCTLGCNCLDQKYTWFDAGSECNYPAIVAVLIF